ncbi:hypothetical protein V8E54_012849 [Elaphomyces granulatus]
MSKHATSRPAIPRRSARLSALAQFPCGTLNVARQLSRRSARLAYENATPCSVTSKADANSQNSAMVQSALNRPLWHVFEQQFLNTLVGKKQQHSSRHRHNEDANRSSRNYFGDKSQTFWQYRESKYPYHLIVSFELPPADLYSRFHHIIPTSFKKRGQYFLATLLILCSRFHHISSDVDIVTKSIKKKGHNFLAIQNRISQRCEIRGLRSRTQRPASNDLRSSPATCVQRHVFSDERPTTSGERPSVGDERPTTQRPTTCVQRPASNDLRPTTCVQRPPSTDLRPGRFEPGWRKAA